MQVIKDINSIKLDASTVALGYFDGVHKAHREVIRTARKHKKENCPLVVFSFSLGDNPPTGKKNADIITSEERKAKILSELGVDIFLDPPFDSIKEMEPEEFIKFLVENLGAKHLSCGYDYRFGKMAKGTADMLPNCSIVSEIPGVSSTNIRNLIKDGRIVEANDMLMSNFTLTNNVLHGVGLGRQMGVPTINMVFPKGFLIPKYGVYATKVIIDDKVYLGITNVGIKPTVDVHTLLVETYIIDFSGDLYDKVVSLEFIQYLRPEMNFGNIENLEAQIKKDILKVLLYKRDILC